LADSPTDRIVENNELQSAEFLIDPNHLGVNVDFLLGADLKIKFQNHLGFDTVPQFQAQPTFTDVFSTDKQGGTLNLENVSGFRFNHMVGLDRFLKMGPFMLSFILWQANPFTKSAICYNDKPSPLHRQLLLKTFFVSPLNQPIRFSASLKNTAKKTDFQQNRRAKTEYLEVPFRLFLFTFD